MEGNDIVLQWLLIDTLLCKDDNTKNRKITVPVKILCILKGGKSNQAAEKEQFKSH